MTDLDRAAALLASTEAAGLLRAALTGEESATVAGFTAELTDLHLRPGAEVTGVFEVGYDLPEGRVTEHLCATTADVPEGTTARASRGDTTFRVWRHPADPRLPGLAPACDPATVLDWLDGVQVPRPNHLDLELLVYRPLRRGVVRYRADEVTVFAKVVRPDRADRLQQRQQLLADAGLSTATLGRTAPGVLLTGRVPGRPLSDVLADPDHSDTLPQAVLGLLDALPDAITGLPARPGWSADLPFHAAAAIAALPDRAAEITRLSERLQVLLSRGPDVALVATHGDLYEANIFREDDGRLWLIDVDRLGPGLLADDLACLLGHLAVLPGLSPEHYAHVSVRLPEWLAAFEARVDPVDLRARTAAVLLSLVPGDPAQSTHRLRLARDWASSAG